MNSNDVGGTTSAMGSGIGTGSFNTGNNGTTSAMVLELALVLLIPAVTMEQLLLSVLELALVLLIPGNNGTTSA